jgi:putative acetyltransferase
MSEPIVRIRPEGPLDLPAIGALVERAFGDRAEAALVELIRASPNYVPELSLVAETDESVVGYVMLSYTELRDTPRTHRVLTLSPIAVKPAAQRRGIGSALVRNVLQLAEHHGQPLVCLEGDPKYYGRFGFTDAREFGIQFDLPDSAPRDAGQIFKLTGYDSSIKGRVVYPPAFAAAEQLRSKRS